MLACIINVFHNTQYEFYSGLYFIYCYPIKFHKPKKYFPKIFLKLLMYRVRVFSCSMPKSQDFNLSAG